MLLSALYSILWCVLTLFLEYVEKYLYTLHALNVAKLPRPSSLDKTLLYIVKPNAIQLEPLVTIHFHLELGKHYLHH